MTRKETPKPADTLASAAPLHSLQPAVVPQTTGTNRPGAELIARYFPELTAVQQQRFTALEGLYREWNAKINVISRIRRTYSRRRVRRRFSRYSAGNPFPRNTIHADRFDR